MSMKASMAMPQGARIVDRSEQTNAYVEPGRRKPFTLKLWLPLTPFWIVLAPFAFALAPLLTRFPATREIPPYHAAVTIGRVLLSLSGTAVEINCTNAVLHIRIF